MHRTNSKWHSDILQYSLYHWATKSSYAKKGRTITQVPGIDSIPSPSSFKPTPSWHAPKQSSLRNQLLVDLMKHTVTAPRYFALAHVVATAACFMRWLWLSVSGRISAVVLFMWRVWDPSPPLPSPPTNQVDGSPAMLLPLHPWTEILHSGEWRSWSTLKPKKWHFLKARTPNHTWHVCPHCQAHHREPNLSIK